eukprot:TRINITY_DN4063_c0_g1_i1.p1 TRINITY_DN4063_c0_g1~~TRINITY_DN4063_c0_g1_i1.p1  ORF type:complete len:319 (+),score=96.32 TRINITY_DN4063_c0_g1_i1:3-959(+)
MNCGQQQASEALRRTIELDAKCPLFERVLGTSPVTEFLDYSSSIEKLSLLLTKKQQSLHSIEVNPTHPSAEFYDLANRRDPIKSSAENTKALSQPQNQPASGTAAQTESKAKESFAFDREVFDLEGSASGFSELTKTMGERKSNTRKADMIIVVFTPTRHRIKVRIDKSATVEEAIRATLHQYQYEGLTPHLNGPIDSYYLMMCEEDGTPDREVPQLTNRHMVQRYGNTFCMQEAGKPIVSHHYSSKPVFTIHLPNNERNTVKFQQNVRLSELLKSICVKKGINPAEYCFHKVGSNNILRLDIGIQDLGVNEIVLSRK